MTLPVPPISKSTGNSNIFYAGEKFKIGCQEKCLCEGGNVYDCRPLCSVQPTPRATDCPKGIEKVYVRFR